MVVEVLKGKGSGNEEWIESAGESTENFESAVSAVRIISRKELGNFYPRAICRSNVVNLL